MLLAADMMIRESETVLGRARKPEYAVYATRDCSSQRIEILRVDERHFAALMGCRTVYGRAITLLTPSKPKFPVLVPLRSRVLKQALHVDQICNILYKRENRQKLLPDLTNFPPQQQSHPSLGEGLHCTVPFNPFSCACIFCM
jgi:hypothetical protein